MKARKQDFLSEHSHPRLPPVPQWASSSSARAYYLETVPDLMRAMVMRARCCLGPREPPRRVSARSFPATICPIRLLPPLSAKDGSLVGGRGDRFRRLLCQLQPAGDVSTSSGWGSVEYSITYGEQRYERARHHSVAVTTIHSQQSTRRSGPTSDGVRPGIPGSTAKQGGVRLAAVAVTQGLVLFVLVSRRRIESGWEESGVRVGGTCPSVWGCA